MEFDERQSDYYYNAGAYIGLFEKKTEDGAKKSISNKIRGGSFFSEL